MNVLGFMSRNNDLFFHTAEQSVTTDTVVTAIEILWRKVKYEWLPLEAYQSYSHLKKWVLEILSNVGEKFQITFA